MATTIKLTSKRQATFPAELCERLGLKPGDELVLIPRVEDGEAVWVLQKKSAPRRPWFGSLRRYSKGVKDHSMEAVRKSVAKGRATRRKKR